MSNKTPKDIMAEYQSAREAAGTVGDGMPCIWSRNGWYRIGFGSYRRSEVEEMTATLLRRAEQNVSET